MQKVFQLEIKRLCMSGSIDIGYYRILRAKKKYQVDGKLVNLLALKQRSKLPPPQTIKTRKP